MYFVENLLNQVRIDMSYEYDKFSEILFRYRVSHSELTKVICVWGLEICKLYFVWRWFWHPDFWTFEFSQQVFKKVA